MAIKGYQFKQTGKEIQAILDGAVMQMQSVTHAELVTLRDGGKLVAGQWYRITDYVTSVSQTPDDRSGMDMIRSAGHPFDIIVRADASGTLNETAFAAPHSGDTYFAGQRMEAWRLSYCLDNDTERFPWCGPTGTGVVYWLRDEKGNEAPYDFKNVQFLRFPLKGPLAAETSYDAMYYDNLADFCNKVSTLFGTYPGFYLHPFSGYMSEQYLYNAGYIDNWGGTYVMQPGGGRLFAFIDDNADRDEDPHMIIEVDTSRPTWAYTFSDSPSSDFRTFRDASLLDHRSNVVTLPSNHAGLGANVLITNGHYGNTNNRMEESVQCTAQCDNNTILRARYSAFGRISDCTVTGNIASLWVLSAEFSEFNAATDCVLVESMNYSRINGSLSKCDFRSLISTVVDGYLSGSGFGNLNYCKVLGQYAGVTFYPVGDSINYADFNGFFDGADSEFDSDDTYKIVSGDSDGNVCIFVPSAHTN